MLSADIAKWEWTTQEQSSSDFMFELKEFLGPTRTHVAWVLALLVPWIAAAAIFGGFRVPDGAQGSSGRTDAILFSDLDWSSAAIQARVAAFIVEHGLGHETELVDGDTNLLWFALVHGDTDVTMEIWLPNQLVEWEQQTALGTVVDAGDSIGENWQGWVVPQYIKDQYPQLVSVFDIPTYYQVFEAPGTNGKARFVGCANGWSCEEVNHIKYRSYEVGEYLHVISPSGEQSLFEDIHKYYRDRQPWIGFMWSPTEPAHSLDLYRLEEPEYSDECWADNKACAYPQNDIRIGVSRTMVERAPDVFEFLQKWDFPSDAQVQTEAWLSENGHDRLDDATLWYLANFQDYWRSYLAPEQAEDVMTSVIRDAQRRVLFLGDAMQMGSQ